MSSQTTTVSDGKAKVTFNTTNQDVGNYFLKVTYPESNEYKEGKFIGNVSLKEFTWNTLTDWSWKLYTGSTSGTITSPSISNGVINMGSRNLMVLNDFIPVRKDAFTLSFKVTSSYSLNRLFLGSYSYDESTDKFNRWGQNIKLDNFINSSQHLVELQVIDGTSYLCVDGHNTDSTFDFSNYNEKFYLMFFSGRKDTLYVTDITFKNSYELYI